MSRFVIDIGTNSSRLLCADGFGENIFPRYKLIRTVRTGEGIHETGLLADAAMERTIAALEEYAGIVGGAETWCFATSAVRDAKNRGVFVEKVKARTGLHVEVLSGEEEARCGATGVLGFSGNGGIVDIGGGSTEVAFSRQGTVTFRQSLNIGCVRALDIFGGGATYEPVLHWAADALRAARAPEGQDAVVHAIGGTATTLAAVAQKLAEYDSAKINGFVLEQPAVEQMARQLFAMDLEQRRKITGLQPQRADIVAFGAAILAAFFEVFGYTSVLTSDRDNLEGFLMLRDKGQI